MFSSELIMIAVRSASKYMTVKWALSSKDVAWRKRKGSGLHLIGVVGFLFYIECPTYIFDTPY